MNTINLKSHNFLTWVTLFLAILILTLSKSQAKQTQPTSYNLKIQHFPERIQKWVMTHHQFIQSQHSNLKLSPQTVVAGVFCFIAASISSAGGIGGGGLYIPILTIVSGFDLKTASSFSAFMVTGGSIANVIYNLVIQSSRFGGKALIDYDIAILSEPCMLLGVSIGVICNLVFPEWLVTVLFSVFLAWSTFKTCKNGLFYWEMETHEMMMNEKEEDGNGEGVTSSKAEPLLNVQGDDNNRVERSESGHHPWMKLGVLVLIWFLFFLLYLLRGNRYGQGIITIEPCGEGYWILSSLQIPLAIVSTAWFLCRRDSSDGYQHLNQQDMEDLTSSQSSNKFTFPVMALLAGVLGGLFGIGGGMLISPLLLHVGISPEVTAATCSFMVFFSSTMSAFQYLLTGMEDTDLALNYAAICFVASLAGLLVVQKAIRQYGRASLIVFSVSIVMGLSTVLITSFGVSNVWNDYKIGNYMGFKLPC